MGNRRAGTSLKVASACLLLSTFVSLKLVREHAFSIPVVSTAANDGEIGRSRTSTTRADSASAAAGTDGAAIAANDERASDRRRGDAVRPVWSCRSAPERRHYAKIVFVHVFKTAGSTLRAFFAEYARRCGVGWAELQCSRVDVDSMGNRSRVWKARGGGGLCWHIKLVRRDGAAHAMGTKIMNEVLEAEADIIGGHVPLGVGRVWPNQTNAAARIQGLGPHEPYRGVKYISFFRNAAQKFVSGVAYKANKRKWREAQILAQIRRVASAAAEKGGHHSKYADYLITPQQRKELSQNGTEMSKEDAAVKIMANLIHYDVVAGITERMPQSMEVLQRLIDADAEAVDVFNQHGLRGKEMEDSNKMEVRLNPSKVSASSLLAEIRNDTDVFGKLLEFVKYEQQITDFALALHLRQHSSLGAEDD